MTGLVNVNKIEVREVEKISLVARQSHVWVSEDRGVH